MPRNATLLKTEPNIPRSRKHSLSRTAACHEFCCWPSRCPTARRMKRRRQKTENRSLIWRPRARNRWYGNQIQFWTQAFNKFLNWPSAGTWEEEKSTTPDGEVDAPTGTNSNFNVPVLLEPKITYPRRLLLLSITALVSVASACAFSSASVWVFETTPLIMTLPWYARWNGGIKLGFTTADQPTFTDPLPSWSRWFLMRSFVKPFMSWILPCSRASMRRPHKIVRPSSITLG